MYKLSAEFPADKAKCKECGGVVEIGPVETRKAAPASKPVPARKPPAGRKPATARKAAPSSRAALPSESETREAPARPARRSSGARTRSRGRAGARGGQEGERRERASRRARQEKKKSWAGMAGALLGLVLIVGGGFWYLNREENARAAEEAEAGGLVADLASSTEEVEAPEAPEAPESGAPETDAGGEAAEPAEPKEPAEKKPEKKVDPSSVDLSVYGPYPRLPGTSDEEWEQIQGWVEDFTDPYAAAHAFNAARDGLIAASRKAFPAILNAYLKVDVSTEEGRKMGDQIQRELLQKICHGRNFDWKYDETPQSQYFNKKVIEGWCKAWEQAKDSDLGWSNLSKIPLEEIQKDSGAKKAVVDDLDDF